MSELTRRGFVKNSAAAAAGLTARRSARRASRPTPTTVKGADPVVAYVNDPGKGEIAVMTGDREVTVRDRKLAARIVRAAG